MKQLLWLLMLLATPAFATLGLVQHPHTSAQVNCTPGCPALTVTSTTGGNIGVMGVTIGVAGASIASISGGGTWVVSHAAPACQGTDATGGASTDIAYNLNLTAATTSITVTLSTTNSLVDMSFNEISHTGAVTFDTCGNRSATTGTSVAGVTLTLNGTNDFILQVGRPSSGTTACGAGFTTPADITTGEGYCGKLNTNSGAANTYTFSPTGTAALSGLAVQEAGGAVRTPTQVLLGVGP